MRVSGRIRISIQSHKLSIECDRSDAHEQWWNVNNSVNTRTPATSDAKIHTKTTEQLQLNNNTIKKKKQINKYNNNSQTSFARHTPIHEHLLTRMGKRCWIVVGQARTNTRMFWSDTWDVRSALYFIFCWSSNGYRNTHGIFLALFLWWYRQVATRLHMYAVY